MSLVPSSNQRGTRNSTSMSQSSSTRRSDKPLPPRPSHYALILRTMRSGGSKKKSGPTVQGSTIEGASKSVLPPRDPTLKKMTLKEKQEKLKVSPERLT